MGDFAMSSRKYEILAPAGTTDSVLPMIEAGADALYVGMKGFSSRPSQTDLTLDQIRWTLEQCHDRGIKLYVAVNVSISEHNLDQVIENIFRLDEMKADAVILSDLGLIRYFSDKLKYAALHASTLLGAYNLETVRMLKRFRVKRIILCANLYLDEMMAIINAVPDMEYELVAEGGTCFNDIRQCLLPHTFINGEHRLFCRDDYRLTEEGMDRPAKPICEYACKAAEVLGIYMGMGITSFKVEGRTVPYQQRLPMVKRLKTYIEAFEKEGPPRAYMHYISRTDREVR